MPKLRLLGLTFIGLVALCCIDTACNAELDETLALRIDVAWSVDERNQILSASDQWNSVTNSTHKFNLDRTAPDQADWLVLKEDPGTGWNGGTRASDHTVKIRPNPAHLPNNPPISVRAVALHELGHVLGLGHPCEATPAFDFIPKCDPAHSMGVMDPETATETFSPEDLSQCVGVGICDR